MAGLDLGDERDEIIADFIVESEELIDRLDQELVQLEEAGDDLNLLNSIFRSAHTIKGTSSFLGFTNMTELTHKMENVLDKMRNQAFPVTPAIMDVLLIGLDGIRNLLEEIRSGSTDTGYYDPEPVKIRLIAIVDSNGQSTEPGAAPAAEEPPAGDDQAIAADKSSKDWDKVRTQIRTQTENLTSQLEGAGGEKPAAEDTGGGGLDLDALLASAPSIEPNLVMPGAAVPKKADVSPKPADQSSVSIDDILAGAPAVTPSIQMPGKKVSSDTDIVKTAEEELKKGTEKVREKATQLTRSIARGQAPVPAAGKAAKKKVPTGAVGVQARGINVEQTIRVDVERLDALMNLAGELVLGRNRLANITRRFEHNDELGDEALMHLSEVVSAITLVASDLQMAVMKTRMLPIGKVFNRFPRMVRDLAREKKKLVDLVIVGGDTEVDKSVIEAIGDPLVHLVRNSVDHGIESPEVRKNAGKSEAGEVILSAQHQGNNVVIMIEDDGAGIDVERIKKKALDTGSIDEVTLSRMTDKEVRLLIFGAGFSTAAEVTNTSGRGVGMDVVKTNIEGLGGTIEIDSEVGKGTVMSIKLPLTLAIIQALMVKAGDESYAISLANVMETVRVAEDSIQSIEGKEVVNIRDRIIPVVRLHEVLDCPGTFEHHEFSHNVYVVIIGLGEQRVGLIVDRLMGQEEVVIKTLGEYLRTIPGIAGSTILGDGRVALIVDVASLMQIITAGSWATRS